MVQFVGITTGGTGYGDAAPVPHTVPATQPGDLVVVVVGARGDGIGPSNPFGWKWTRVGYDDNQSWADGGFTYLWGGTWYAISDGRPKHTITTVPSADLETTIISVWRDAVVEGVNSLTPAEYGNSSWSAHRWPSGRPGVVVQTAGVGTQISGSTGVAATSAGWTTRGSLTGPNTATGLWSADYSGAGQTPAGTFTTVNEDGAATGAATIYLTGSPPNAPTLTTMVNGAAVDRATVNRARHEFSDPYPEDSQSAFDIRWRAIGATTWQTAYVVTPNQWYDFPAGTFALGDYERQVRTYDAQGLVGPWSTSGFFTVAVKPTGPTITDPVGGQFVEQTHVVTWSVPNQTLYEVRRVADNAGVPDPTTVHWTSGEVASTSARALEVAFPVNGRPEHIQLRVQHDGLWSEWASVAVDVSYDAPPVPTFTLSPDALTGSLLVTISNPAPGVDQEPTAYNDVYIDDGDGEERRVTGVSPNGQWRFWTPISGRDYSGAVRVVAVAANQTTTSS